MDIIKLLQSRYTTKVYDPSFRLSEEQLATIKALKAVLAEESWSNLE